MTDPRQGAATDLPSSPSIFRVFQPQGTCHVTSLTEIVCGRVWRSKLGLRWLPPVLQHLPLFGWAQFQKGHLPMALTDIRRASCCKIQLDRARGSEDRHRQTMTALMHYASMHSGTGRIGWELLAMVS